jgi:hypothetical protein
MKTVSTDFTLAAIANTRKAIAKVEIAWTDPFLDASIIASANDNNRISYPQQCADLVNYPTRKWAHLDDTIAADGSFHPMPNSATWDDQVGWFGATACDASAVWSEPYPTLTITFSERPVLGLWVAGNSIYDEYPVDFDIVVYTTGDVIALVETVTDNDAVIWSKNISDLAINNVVKMQLIVKKWSHAGRVVKICEFYSTVIGTYYDSDIVSMDILEEREISDGSLPVGNISANELDLTLQNIKTMVNGSWLNDPFSPGNTNSYLHNLIKKNRKITAYIGFQHKDRTEFEFVKVGTFWSGDWSYSQTSATVSTTARDRMELLRNATYSTNALLEDVNLYTVAEAVLNSAKLNIPMPDLKWSIDIRLKNYVMEYAWFPKQNYMKTIRAIAEAGRGQAYMSKDDVLIIEGGE